MTTSTFNWHIHHKGYDAEAINQKAAQPQRFIEVLWLTKKSNAVPAAFLRQLSRCRKSSPANPSNY